MGNAVLASLVGAAALYTVTCGAPPLTPVGQPCCAGADGYTDFQPSPDTRKIYVSSSTGSDDNSGLSETAPVKTIAKGESLLRDGYPDWLLLKKGDVFHESLDLRLSGRSATEPLVVWSYGSGTERPTLMTGLQSGILVQGGGGGPSSVNHVAYVGLRFYEDEHDPSSPDFVPGATASSGLSWLLGTDDLLVEDCVFQSYANGMVVQRLGDPIGNVRIRYVQVLDSYNTNGHSEGLFTSGVDSILVEHSLFDHNGWIEGVPGAEPTVFNHNAYFHEEPGQVVLRDDIFLRGSSHGAQMRPGGTAIGNLFVRNPISLLIGGGDNPLPGVTGDVEDNVILEGDDIAPDALRGWGLNLDANVASAVVRDNIVAHNQGGYPFAVIDDSAGSVTYQGNIAYDWPNAAAGFNSTTGPFVDPNRSLASYDALLGGPGTFDHLVRQLRSQSRDHYNGAYTAGAINAYIRAGFAQP